MGKGVIRIEDKLVKAGQVGPAAHARNDGLIPAHAGFFHDLANKTGADDAFADETLAHFQLPSEVENGHLGTGAGTARGAVYGALAKGGSGAGTQDAICPGFGRPVKLDSVDGAHKREFRVSHRKLSVGRLAQAGAQVGQGSCIGGNELQTDPFRFNQDEEAAAVNYIHR